MMEYIVYLLFLPHQYHLHLPQKIFFTTHVNIYKENEELKKKIEVLEKDRFDNLYLQTENNQLQEVLELDKTTAYSTVGAKIMLDKNSPYLNSRYNKQRIKCWNKTWDASIK